MYGLTTTGFDDNIDLMNRLGDESIPVIQEELHRMMQDVVAEARSILHNNTNIVSGDLQASVVILNEEELEGEVGTEVMYAVFIEFGRGPIRAARGKVLHWVDPKTGKDVFTKFSRAFDGQPFLEPAAITMSDPLADNIHNALTEKLRELE